MSEPSDVPEHGDSPPSIALLGRHGARTGQDVGGHLTPGHQAIPKPTDIDMLPSCSSMRKGPEAAASGPPPSTAEDDTTCHLLKHAPSDAASQESTAGSGLVEDGPNGPGSEASIYRQVPLFGSDDSDETLMFDEDARWRHNKLDNEQIRPAHESPSLADPAYESKKRKRDEYPEEVAAIKAETYEHMLLSNGKIDDHNELWDLLESIGDVPVAQDLNQVIKTIDLLWHYSEDVHAFGHVAQKLQRLVEADPASIAATGVSSFESEHNDETHAEQRMSANQDEHGRDMLHIDVSGHSSLVKHNTDQFGRWVDDFSSEVGDHVVYTDGSVKNEHGGASIALTENGRWVGEFKALGPADSLTAELAGIDRGLGHGLETLRIQGIRRLIIRTDCLAALKCIMSIALLKMPRPVDHGIMNDISEKLGMLSSSSIIVQLLWVKGHAICPGNYVADVLAGRASDKTSQTPAMHWTKQPGCTWLDQAAARAFEKGLTWAQDPHKRRKLESRTSARPSSSVPLASLSSTPQFIANGNSSPTGDPQTGLEASGSRSKRAIKRARRQQNRPKMLTPAQPALGASTTPTNAADPAPFAVPSGASSFTFERPFSQPSAQNTATMQPTHLSNGVPDPATYDSQNVLAQADAYGDAFDFEQWSRPSKYEKTAVVEDVGYEDGATFSSS